ncbi:protein-serine/threonine phosphatase [Trifolium repens]|nr:protein-serine/threonine phosphatase [Trifolium repens]
MSCSVAVSNSTVFSLSSPCHFSLPSPVLKRHRPAKLHIPVASLTVEILPPVPSPVPAKDIVEVEGVGFSVYCKKGSRKQMEDRYSASVNLHGESKQAFFGT